MMAFELFYGKTFHFVHSYGAVEAEEGVLFWACMEPDGFPSFEMQQNSSVVLKHVGNFNFMPNRRSTEICQSSALSSM